MQIESPSKGVVLVVDDEPGLRQLARRILEAGGYGVIEAGDGQQALGVMASMVRALRPDMRVLSVTAHSDVLFRERPELLEGEAFLDKPFTRAGLIEAVSLLKTGFVREAPPPKKKRSMMSRIWRSTATVGCRTNAAKAGSWKVRPLELHTWDSTLPLEPLPFTPPSLREG